MVRRAEGPRPDQGDPCGEGPCHRIELRGLQRLLLIHVGQDGGDPLGQHTFPGAGWADHHHIVPARSRDLQRPLCPELAAHIGKVRKSRRGFIGLEMERRNGCDLFLPAQMGKQLRHMRHRVHADSGYRCTFCRIIGRNENTLDSPLFCLQKHGQHAVDPADSAA